MLLLEMGNMNCDVYMFRFNPTVSNEYEVGVRNGLRC